MSVEPSSNAKEIFLAAIEIEQSADRYSFVNDSCGSDLALRQRVNALILAHEAPESLLDRKAPEIVDRRGIDPTVGASNIEWPGMEIGPYKLRERLGTGGMGVVWAAEQKRPLKRKVALKLIKPGMDTEQILARFEAEREALSLMDHPNIARVLDAGTTDQGRPYFAMELIRGVPINEYCDAKKLTIKARVELFVQCCRAVQHAHQKGVIHRDIKPSNVLVSEQDGTPIAKVIDFGVAKALHQPLTNHSIYTGVFQAIGTLAYMSPEQAGLSVSDIDARADIYGLGVLLYELLTGRTPFDREELESAAFEEACRLIREKDPPKPSTRITSLGDQLTAVSVVRGTDSAALTRMIRGDLDWIVMKSLDKDRGRRYETASTFADDLQRYLECEPIEARPPSSIYRLRKFVRRNRALVTSAIAVLLILCFATAKARRDHHIAQSSLERLEQVAQDWAMHETLSGHPQRAADAIALAENAGVSDDWLKVFRGLSHLYEGQADETIAILSSFMSERPGSSRLCGLATLAMAFINSGDDPGYLKCMALIREREPETDDEVLFVAMAESAADHERVLALLNKPLAGGTHPIALMSRSWALGWKAIENRDSEAMAMAMNDVRYAELFAGSTPALVNAKASTLRTAYEFTRISGRTTETKELEEELRDVADDLIRLPYSITYRIGAVRICSLLGEFDEALKILRETDFEDAVSIEYAAAAIFANIVDPSKGLEILESLKIDNSNPYGLISRAHFIAEIPERRGELKQIYHQAVSVAPDSLQARIRALTILALDNDLDSFEQEAARILNEFDEEQLGNWGMKEALMVARGSMSQAQLEEVENIITRCMAYHYLALRHLANDKPGDAMDTMKRCTDAGVWTLFEYSWSDAYLNRTNREGR